MRVARVGVVASIVLSLAGCSAARFSVPATEPDEAAYSALFPYYVEFCAVSQLRKKPGFGAKVESGFGGHSVLYLNGVCKVKDAHYPEIALCDDGPEVAENGVGLSVNAHYKNANWVATEGRDFFFHGGLDPAARLTRADYARVQAKAEAMGIYDGVQFHREVFDDMPAGMPREDFKYEMSVATDYAIGFGRDRYCARVPMSRDKMARVVTFLNGLNEPYRRDDKEFEWDILRDNCAHVTHNALATVDLWDEWPIDRFVLFAAFDFPVPKNEFVNLVRRTNDAPVDDLPALYADSAARRALLNDDWLPTEPGAIVETEPVFQKNDVYDTDLMLIFYDDPILGRYQSRFDRIFADPRYTDLRANLEYFVALFDKVERDRRPLATYPERTDPGFVAFYDRYYDLAGRQSAVLRAGLAGLQTAPRLRPAQFGSSTTERGMRSHDQLAAMQR
ncbi:MAG: hypothetical protein JWL84_1408 [Rhodospirillales bacterium]|jgi:hypothetical protein|nr:hypothetical protein [Rhodospirillales bacterium]